MMARRFLLYFLCLLLFSFFLSPFLLETPLGTNLVCRYLSYKTGWRWEAKSSSFAWIGAQTLAKGSVVLPQGVAYFDELNLEVSLPVLLINKGLPDDAILFVSKGSIETADRQGIRDVRGQFVYRNKRNFEWKGEGITFQKGQKGSFSFGGRLRQYGRPQMEVVSHLQATALPTQIISFFYPPFGTSIAPLIGSPLTADASLNYFEGKGKVDLSASSPSGDVSLHGDIEKGMLSLREPLVAHFQIASDVSDILLEVVNPLLNSSLYSKKGGSLVISKEGFQFPLFPYLPEWIEVKQGTLDLGVLVIKNSSSLAPLFQLLSYKGLLEVPEVEFWTTPLSFRVHQGIVDMGRMDVLVANAVHLCSWGRINLPRDQLDLTLGVAADTLQKALRLRDIPKSFVLKIPVRGSIKDPVIDFSRAGTTVAAMLAAKKAGGGFFGGAMGSLAQPESAEETPPPPKSLPWKIKTRTPPSDSAEDDLIECSE